MIPAVDQALVNRGTIPRPPFEPCARCGMPSGCKCARHCAHAPPEPTPAPVPPPISPEELDEALRGSANSADCTIQPRMFHFTEAELHEYVSNRVRAAMADYRRELGV